MSTSRRTILAVLSWALLSCSLFESPNQAAAQEHTGLEAAAAIEQAMIDAIARCERSVVAISRVRRDESEQLAPEPGQSDFVPNEFATGVVIDAHGLILTNAHVLGGDEFAQSDFFVTTIDRKTYPAKVKAADPRGDLAVLEIAATDLTPIRLGSAKALKKGQIVIALGNPYAIARDGQPSASWGIVANLARKMGPNTSESAGESRPTIHHFGTLIQTDAKLNLGTSGGALINLKGEMVGLTTAVAAIAGYEASAGYAIPVDDTFLRAVERLKQGREVEYGFLGVWPMDLTASAVLQGAFGAQINSVVPGTPADRADLRRNDIVVAVDGERVHDADQLMLAVGRLPVESLVRLAVVRTGSLVELTPLLAKFPVRGQKVVTENENRWRGMTIDYLTSVLDGTARPNVPLGEGGVIVEEVAPESAAAKGLMQPNMVVTHVDGTRVQSPKQFLDAVQDKPGAVELRLWLSPADRPARTIEAE
jgi:serine protease Do